MARLFILFIASIFIASCQPKDLPTEFKADKDESYARLSHMTTKDELKVMQEDLKSVGITFDYSNTIFFDNGHIKTLRLVVILDDGTVGTCPADLVALQYHYYGFEFNKTKQPKLRTGALN